MHNDQTTIMGDDASNLIYSVLFGVNTLNKESVEFLFLSD